MKSRFLMTTGLVALFLSSVSGCKKDEAPQPDPAAATPANTAVSARAKINTRNPIAPMAKIDPQAMKDYRLDICYFGTLTLRQARDSYLASLGKDEPSEKKIPNFGIPAPPTAPPTPPAVAVLPGAASARATGLTPPPPAAPTGLPRAPVLPTGSAAPPSGLTAPTVPPRPNDFAFRAPHERNARVCTATMTLKDPPMGDVDTAVANYAPFAVELARDIATASSYYQREEYKKDGFAKGKELHKKLVDEFAKLDDLQEKLSASVAAWRKDHPPDPEKQEAGEKVVADTLVSATKVLRSALDKRIDVAGYKANVDKLDKAIVALKAFSTANVADNWTKILAGPFDGFLRMAKDAKVTSAGVDPDGFLNLVTNYTSILESRQRALSRALISKGQTAPLAQPASPVMVPGGLPAPSAAPAPQ